MAHRRTAALAALTLSATGLTVAGLSGGSAQAADSTPGYSLQHVTVNVAIGPDHHRCVVDADIYKPDKASRTSKKPAILTTNGFGGSKDDGNESAIGRGFVKQGYVVLAYTGLGFPNSGCKITLDDPAYDGQAGKQMVSVLAGTKSYLDASKSPHRIGYVAQESKGDPRVGMIGGSYGGQIQYAVAMQDKRVDALIPIITWNDLSYSLAPNNTSLTRGVTYSTEGVAKKQWTDLFFSVGITDGVQGGSVDPSRNAPPCPNFADAACPGIAKLNTLGYPDAATLQLARHASVSTYLKRITAPTLVVQGQKDTLFNLQEAVATFKGLRAQGTPTRLIWQSWGHSDSNPAPGELDFNAPSLRDSYLGRRFLNWMNHYVKGNAKAPVGSRFSYFRDWVPYDTRPAYAGRAIQKAYAEKSTFSQAPTSTLYFTGNDGLTTSSNVATGSASYANTGPAPTSYSETSGLEGSQVNNPPSDAPGTAVSFTTAPLAAPADLVGSSRLRLNLSAPLAAQSQAAGPGGKLGRFAKIYDVAPDGTQTLHNRLISPVRVADVTQPVSITLPGVAQEFAAGHRIRVTIAASDFAYGGNAAAQPVTITTSAAAPSLIRMPLTTPLRLQ
jgi:ABC-2 type transport system ATP-binding protein